MAYTDRNDEDKKKELPVAPETYTMRDLIDFEDGDTYSAFGRMNISTKPTAAKYGFGKAHRNDGEKVYFSKKHCKAQFLGKTSKGPNFEGTDRFAYNKAPGWVMGKNPRNTLDIKQPYVYYNRFDGTSNPVRSDKNRRPRSAQVIIGTEGRQKPSIDETKGVPGPKYDPGFNQQVANTVKSSFGYRRDVPGQSALNQCISTGYTVGPGSYFRYSVVAPNTSRQRNSAACKFPEKKRFGDQYKRFVKNETYEVYKSCWNQTRSQKVSQPHINFTKAKRDNNKLGFNKDATMQRQAKVVIPMPKFF